MLRYIRVYITLTILATVVTKPFISRKKKKEWNTTRNNTNRAKFSSFLLRYIYLLLLYSKKHNGRSIAIYATDVHFSNKSQPYLFIFTSVIAVFV